MNHDEDEGQENSEAEDNDGGQLVNLKRNFNDHKNDHIRGHSNNT